MPHAGAPDESDFAKEVRAALAQSWESSKGTQQWCAALRLYGHLRTCTESDVRQASAVGRAEGAGSVRVNSPQYALVRRRLTRDLVRWHAAAPRFSLWIGAIRRSGSTEPAQYLQEIFPRWTRTAEIPLLNQQAAGDRDSTDGTSEALPGDYNRKKQRVFGSQPRRETVFRAVQRAGPCLALAVSDGFKAGNEEVLFGTYSPRARSRTTFSMFFDWIRITPQARARSKGRRSSPDQ